uniref:Peptidase S1 domain-containing protein n=2 Tax=Graphocephala atropunctata TaxID=36148 RepID=A0A1B6MQB4_9HEMI
MTNWLMTIIPLLALVLTVAGQYNQNKILQVGQKLERLPHDLCGESSDAVFEKKITNGDPAELGAYPWMAALGFTKGNVRNPSWSCGGSLITDQYVLTAAHCLDPSRTAGYRVTVVRLGDLDLASNTDGATPIDVEVEKIVYHPEYDNVKKTNDIGLIKLKKKVEFYDKLKPICLPSPEFRTNTFVNLAAKVAGWGVNKNNLPSSRLLEAELQVTDLGECRRNLTSAFPQVLIDKRIVCAYANDKDSCQGDSGGPLMMFRRLGPKSKMFILGVVSYGNKCALEGYPGVYTRVSEFMPWIMDNIDI